MSAIDPSLFTDVADTLGIGNPIIVEKDYYAVQLLKELGEISFEGYQLVFAGGTCLVKVHKNTYRMSEDIDIKLIASEEVLAKSGNKQRQLRREVHQIILDKLEQSPQFRLINPAKIRNEGRYQQFLIGYPSHHSNIDSLRSHLQMDLTESQLLEPAVSKPIRSLFAEVTKQDHEIQQFPCVTVGSIASEKFVALLRRIAAFDRDNTLPDDKTLIRHVYDLHLIGLVTDLKSLKSLVQRVIKIDLDQFGNRHKEFQKKPQQELQRGLHLLIEQPIHRDRYRRFLGPLVYHSSPANWETAMTTVRTMAKEWLN